MKTFWVVVMVITRVVETGRETDHNKDSHNALCDLLKSVVAAFQSKSGGDAFRKALHQTIFGNESGGNLENLRNALPTVYKGEDVSRSFFCGEPREGTSGVGNRERWPGHSAPHDLVCLCTLGKNGWPLSGTDTDKEKGRLCGKTKGDLGQGDNQGWGTPGKDHRGQEQIDATWGSVTKDCLKNDGEGYNLQAALENFKNKLVKTADDEHNERYRLGESSSDKYPCSGNEKICVMYYNSTEHKHPMPWWTELQRAIGNYEEIQAKKKSKEETSKQENAQKQRKTQKHEQSQLPQGPHTAPVKATKQDPTDIEQENTENLSTPIATLEEASSTLITPPYSWLISAVFFI